MSQVIKFLRIGLVALVLVMAFAPSTATANILDNDGNIKQGAGPNVRPVSPMTTEPIPAQTQTNTNTNTKGSGSGDAASGDIFTILQKKIYDTLVDLRKIVYVVAGFGLVVFAVAAIFNKISYKHLGYIMIGLSLLSLMFPFLEYFSGYDPDNMLAQDMRKEMAFKNYLAASDYKRIRGELDGDVLNGDGQGQEALSPEEIARRREENSKNALQPIDSSGITGAVTTSGSGGLAGLEQRMAVTNAGCNPSTMKGGWNAETGSRTVCTVDSNGNVQTTQEACPGTVKNGSCTKTFGQRLGDAWGTATDIIQGGLNAGNAFNSAMGAILNTGAAARDMLNVATSGQLGFGDTLKYLAGQGSSNFGQTGNVINNLHSTIAALQLLTQNAGNTASRWSTDYNDNPTGSNPFTDLMNALGGYTNSADKAVGNAGQAVDNVADVGSEIHTQGVNINTIFSLFKGSGTSWSDKWKSVFGGK